MKQTINLMIMISTVYATCNTDKDCQNMAVCQQGVCHCPDGFGGDNCATPLCGSPFDAQLQANGKACVCTNGWMGPNCQVCQQDSACQSADVKTCSTDQFAWRKKDYYCNVKDDVIMAVIGKWPDFTASCDTVASTCTAQIWLGNTTQFSCALTQCSQGQVDNNVVWTCSQAKCLCSKPSELCDNPLPIKDVLESIAGPTTLKCTSDQSCNFFDPKISQYFPQGIGAVDCHYGECGSSTSMKQTLTTSQKTGLGVGVGLIATIIVLTALVLCQRKSFVEQTDEQVKVESFEFRNIKYSVKHKQILDSISCKLTKGQMMAVLGQSGAGKTSLMDILAGAKKSGLVQGQVYLNGDLVRFKDVKLQSTYVDQQDVLMPMLTVRETIQFAAQCRLKESLDLDFKVARVEEIMKQLHLNHIADSMITSKLGISGGEARRVSIAVQLVTNPSILFLDEITSGLDSRSCYSVTRYIRDICKEQGTIVVMNIHQPSKDVFALFDKVLLLDNGKLLHTGYVDQLPQFFDRQHFVCPQGANLADHLIDFAHRNKGIAVVQNDIETSIKDSKSTLELVVLGSQPDIVVQEDSEYLYGTSFSHQFKQIAYRTMLTTKRNPSLILSQFVISMAAYVALGVVFYHQNNSLPAAQNRFGSLFFTLVFLAFLSSSALSSFSKERKLFMRERARGLYTSNAYFTVKVLYDMILLRLIPVLVGAPIVYTMIGYVQTSQSFTSYLLVLSIFNCTMGLVNLLIGICIKDQSTANIVSSSYMLFGMLFAGLLTNLKTLNTNVAWLQYLSLFRFPFEAIAVNEATQVTFVDSIGGETLTVSGAIVVQSLFGMDVNSYNRNVIIAAIETLLIAIVVFIVGHFRLKEVK